MTIKKPIIFSLSVMIMVAILSGFAASKSTQRMGTKMHIKDLPKHGLRLIDPSDPKFDQLLRAELKDTPNEVVDTIRPFSVFFENGGDRDIVGYLVQWCFTKADGSNQYYRKAVMNPQAFMDAEPLSEEAKNRSGRIQPASSRFLSLLSADGSGTLRAELTTAEAGAVRDGMKFDRTTLLQRFSKQVANYTDITVSIDAAFFDDGTFVGPDSSNFFSQTQAVVAAKRDLLEEISNQVTNNKQTRDEVYKRIEVTAGQAAESLDSDSSPADYYDHFKKLYANEILRMRTVYGEAETLALAKIPLNRPWVNLHKKEY